METPPKVRNAPTLESSNQLHARLKRQMQNEMDVKGNPEMERMGDEEMVHAGAIMTLVDDYDDDDLE
ncbi:hypothetical protein PsorP6_011624 [Peronosclerospora sorghi]|uniref:Uncharacterized protein n=1 Tax=Peronosclerospora sorghi TaxID=230839 RepID=A0ACC0WIE5_9STRA|nr:hypothetical protein PsorP6_011624 [Peronosclerospora sorghi]